MRWKNVRLFISGGVPLIAGLALIGAVASVVFLSGDQSVSLVDASSFPLGLWSDEKALFRYDNSASDEITVLPAEDGQGHYIHSRFLGPGDNGLGFAVDAAAPRAASLRIHWRIRGRASYLILDLMDGSLSEENNENGENFSFYLDSLPSDWQTQDIPLSYFSQNSFQNPQSRLDGYFDTHAIRQLLITVPRGSLLELDLAKIELVWPSQYTGQAPFLLLIALIGLLIWRRSARSRGADFSDWILSGPGGNRSIYCLVSVSYFYLLFFGLGEVSFPIASVYFSFYALILMDEFFGNPLDRHGLGCSRYAGLLCLADWKGFVLPIPAAFLLSFTAFVPAIRYHRSVLLIPIVFVILVLCILFNASFDTSSYYLYSPASESLLFLSLQFIAAALIREFLHHRDTRVLSQRTASLYQDLFENTSDGIYTISPEGAIQSINRGFADLVGLPEDRILQRPLYDWISEPDQIRLEEERQRNIHGSTHSLEIPILHADGEPRTVLLRERPILEEGIRIGYQGIATNITERKKAEEKLCQQEQLYRHAIEIAGAVPYSLNHRLNRYDFVGDNVLKLTGYSAPEFTYDLFGTLVKEQVFLGELKGLDLSSALQKVRSDRSLNWLCEYRITTKSGEERWLFNASVQVADREGHCVGSLGILMDITERKQLEEVLRRQSLTFRYMHDGLLLLDLSGRIIDWNPATRRMFGYADEEWGSLPLGRLFPKPDCFQFDAVLRDVSQKGCWKGDLTYLHKEGREGICETVVVPLGDEKGRTMALFCINHDITDRCRAEEEHRALEEKLQQSQKMEALGRLAGGVAHDFNNLLTAIRGYCEILSQDIPCDSQMSQDLGQIHLAAERASDLTRQLLVFSRRQVTHSQIVDMNRIVSDMEKMLRRVIGEDIEFVTHLWAEKNKIKADPGQIEMVLMNLVVNARDAMPNGGRILIETSTVTLEEGSMDRTLDLAPGSYVRVIVQDNGIGMDPAVKPRIFEPFFTTKEQGKGTGLGLSSVYGIVSQCDGRIRVDSLPGQGTTFSLFLPCVGEPAAAPAALAVSSQPARGSETILLVEDEDSVRFLVRRILESRGFQVREAALPKAALEICAHARDIDLVLSDVIMPQMNGRELRDKLLEQTPNLQFLFMSGYTDDTILKHGIFDDGIPFLQKPFTADILVGKIRQILDLDSVKKM